MTRTLGTICLIVGALVLFTAFAPWLTCIQGYPANVTALLELGRELSIPDNPGAGGLSEAASICLDAYPPQRESLPMGLGLGGIILGVILRIMGNAPSRREDPALPEHLTTQEVARHQPLVVPRQSSLSAEEMQEGIELDEELDLGLGGDGDTERRPVIEEEEETLMDQVERQLDEVDAIEAERQEERATVDGFFCPKGMSKALILYVDRGHEGATDDDSPARGRSVDEPFATIEAAIERAREMTLKDGQPVQVRLMPGIYQEALKIPGRVMVVNHRTPAEGGHPERLHWLLGQHDVDQQDRVTILPPADARVAVEFEPGGAQGIFGCHIVSRDGTRQLGVKARHSDGVSIANCIIENFRKGGVEVEKCGSDLAMGGVQLLGCGLRQNRAPHGGAVAISQSAVNIDGCLFEENVARCGGGVWAADLRAPLRLVRCEFRSNRAQTKSVPERALEAIEAELWEDFQGTGGAVWLAGSHVKILSCEFRENGASVAGGGVAMFSSRAIIHGEEEKPTLFKSCRARTGGALFASAWATEKGTIRGEHMRFERNTAKRAGGALALIGHVTMQLGDSRFEYNNSDKNTGRGGAAAIYNGSELIGTGLLFHANQAAEGGGLVALNGSVRLKDHSIFQDNVASLGHGGGALIETVSLEHLEALVANKLMRRPFVLKLLDVEFVGNLAIEAPAGLSIHTPDEGAVMALGVELGDALDFRANRVKSGSAQQAGDQMLITWRGAEHMNEATMGPGKFALK